MTDYVHAAISKLRFQIFSRIIPDINDFNYSIIKGETLSLQAYGSEGRRFGSDIDILTTRKDIANIESVLKAHGFNNVSHTRNNRITMMTCSHQTVPWVKEVESLGQITVDINHDVFWGEYEGKRFDMEEFLLDAIKMDVYGVKIKTLPAVKTMIQLILHHYKDMNSIFLLATRKSIKYDMFKDVYYLLKNNIDIITLDKLYTMSCMYNIVPYVFYVLYYTGQVFDDEILKKYIEAFKTPEGEALINCYGLCDKEKKEWKFDFKTRLKSENLYELIKDDLSEKDQEKINMNKRVFLGVS